MLQDELGIDPPPRLKELERLVLQQDGSLDLSPREQATGLDVPPTVAVPTRAPLGSVEFRILGPLEVRDGEPRRAARRRAAAGGARAAAARGEPRRPGRPARRRRLGRRSAGVRACIASEPPVPAASRTRRPARHPGAGLPSPRRARRARSRAVPAARRGGERRRAGRRRRAPARRPRALARAPLADLAAEPAGRAAAHLGELRLSALEDRFDADLALGGTRAARSRAGGTRRRASRTGSDCGGS